MGRGHYGCFRIVDTQTFRSGPDPTCQANSTSAPPLLIGNQFPPLSPYWYRIYRLLLYSRASRTPIAIHSARCVSFDYYSAGWWLVRTCSSVPAHLLATGTALLLYLTLISLQHNAAKAARATTTPVCGTRTRSLRTLFHVFHNTHFCVVASICALPSCVRQDLQHLRSPSRRSPSSGRQSRHTHSTAGSKLTLTVSRQRAC